MRAMLFSWLLVAMIGAARPAAAEELRGVVELFTSQGCSSCPPADRLLAKLAQEPGLIALSFPVDYWDYLGWKDTLASPAFTARQKGYAAARGDGQIYTPQAVIDGVVHAVGSDHAEIDAALTKAAPGGLHTVAMKVSRTRDSLSVVVGAASSVAPGTVWLLRVARVRSVPVGRGENAGRKLTYANVVRGMVRVGEWHGSPETMTLPLARTPGGEGEIYVALLQAGSDARPGRILAAAQASN